MTFRRFIPLVLLISAAFSGCGLDAGGNIILEGTLERSWAVTPELAAAEAPLFVAVSNTDDFSLVISDPLNTIIELTSVETGAGDFSVDLTDSGVGPGDTIYLFAFTDNDFSNSVPFPGPGDMVGFYINEDTLSMAYMLEDGVNGGINIKLNREVFDYSAEVEGTLRGEENGDVFLVAYAGELTGMDFTDIDVNAIIGYSRIKKTGTCQKFTLPIIPYGFDAPVNDVYIFAILDRNGSGLIDEGDIIGFLAGDDGYPSTMTIFEGPNFCGDIEFIMDIMEPSGYDAHLTGAYTLPDGMTDIDSGAVFIIVSDSNGASNLLSSPLASLKTYYQVPAGQKTFDVDLSQTDLTAGEDITIFALWDRDFDMDAGGFPVMNQGDMIGYYIDDDSLSMNYTLQSLENPPVTIAVDKTHYGTQASVQGTVNGTESGRVLLIAYTGEINSLDMTQIDTDKIVAYQSFTKGASSLTYELEILPFYTLPLENVTLFAILDRNNNGSPDAGDGLGFYADNEYGIPSMITVPAAGVTGININFVMDITDTPDPGGEPMRLIGDFEAPDGYDENSPPIFLLVTESSSMNILDNLFTSLLYYGKLEPGSTHFDIDLAATGLQPDDGTEIMVIAIWDRNYDGGFVYPDAGDKIGYCQNKENMKFSFPVTAGDNVIPQSGWDFRINRTIHDHDARLVFVFNEGVLPFADVNGKNVIMVAVQGGGISTDLLNFFQIDDIDYVIGLQTVTALDADGDGSFASEYIYMDIFPFIFDEITVGDNFRIDNVYLIGILDVNGNGLIDDGENIGYYWTTIMFNTIYFPAEVTRFDGKSYIENRDNVLKKSVRFSSETY